MLVFSRLCKAGEEVHQVRQESREPKDCGVNNTRNCIQIQHVHTNINQQTASIIIGEPGMPGFYIHRIIMGPKGDHGEPGLPGQPGNKGQKGNAGRDGIDGEPGYSSSISGIIPKSGLKWQLT